MKKFTFILTVLMFALNMNAQNELWPNEPVNTGSNATYLVNSVTFNGNDLVFGKIGAFFINDLGNYQCGGWQTWTGSNTQIAAMGDDSTTEEKDGFEPGEEIIWLGTNDNGATTYLASVTYVEFMGQMGNSNFTANTVNIISPFAISNIQYCINDADGDGICDENESAGCTDPDALNYNADAEVDDGSCIAIVLGCTDESADNYNEDANTDDGTCSIAGCMNNEAQNYNEGATYDDGSCIIIGCTDQNAFNYNSNATEDDGSCVDIIYGCTNWSMCNYDPLANTNDGSCYNNDIGCGCDVPAPQEGYNCLGLPVLASVGDTLFGGIVFYMDDLGQSGLIAAMSDISGSYQFGCNGSFVSAFNWNIGGGQANTTNISNSCGGGSAAGRANNFTFDDYNDWFLPSIYSLEEIYNSIGPGGLNLTDFANSFYWSSTYSSPYYALGVDFSTGDRLVKSKTTSGIVRPIRAFSGEDF